MLTQYIVWYIHVVYRYTYKNMLEYEGENTEQNRKQTHNKYIICNIQLHIEHAHQMANKSKRKEKKRRKREEEEEEEEEGGIK